MQRGEGKRKSWKTKGGTGGIHLPHTPAAHEVVFWQCWGTGGERRETKERKKKEKGRTRQKRRKIWEEGKRNVEDIRKNTWHLDAKLVSEALEV